MPAGHKNIFVVIPAWNEHAAIRQVVQDLIPYHYRLVIVDDGSSPPLFNELKELPVYYLRHRINLGQGAAIRTGIGFALENAADYIVSFDADGQHLAGDIEQLIAALQDADMALGSRFLPGAGHNMTTGRKWLLRMARLVNFLFTGRLLSDAHNGLRAMTRSAAEKIRLTQNGMAHATEIISAARRAGLRITEVPVTIKYTEYSRNKGQTASDSFRILFDLFLSKFSR